MAGADLDVDEKRKAKHSSSKYDFVKVRVWLQDDAEAKHYYVLSRFLVSRVLTVTLMDYRHAIRLALELKKQLVDAQRLDLTHGEMEGQLFELMRANGYGGVHIDRFRMMSAFHQRRIPLIILVAGTGCIGKSILTTQLAERLNLPNIVQTDWAHTLLCDAPACGDDTRVWRRRFGTEAALVAEYRREAAAVSQAVEADLLKARKDGKALIVEGAPVPSRLIPSDPIPSHRGGCARPVPSHPIPSRPTPGLHLDPMVYEVLYDRLFGDGRAVVVPFVLSLDGARGRYVTAAVTGSRHGRRRDNRAVV